MKSRVCVVGLGYVGLPLAVAFDSAGYETFGYDVDERHLEKLQTGQDPLQNVDSSTVNASTISFTADPSVIQEADYVLITVPTPVDDDGTPDLAFVKSAGRTVGAHLSRGSIVVLESTVYPGTTHGVLRPILERASEMRAGTDFGIGYSAERMSPGDSGRSIADVTKVISGDSDRTVQALADLYRDVVDAGVHAAPSTEVAEAAKCVENVQRDVNIALMNELAELFHKLDIDTSAVLNAADTKWNFHRYQPGLVGGHCIPVDPHYLIHQAERHNYSPQLIKTARSVNESFPNHLVSVTVNALEARSSRPHWQPLLPDGSSNQTPSMEDSASSESTSTGSLKSDCEIVVAGLSYKPESTDLRSQPIRTLTSSLADTGASVSGYDPYCSAEELQAAFDVPIRTEFDVQGVDALVIPTGHTAFRSFSFESLKRKMADAPVIVDVQGVLDEPVPDGMYYYRP